MTPPDDAFGAAIGLAAEAVISGIFTLLAAGPILDPEERALLRLHSNAISRALEVPLDDEGPDGPLLGVHACAVLASEFLGLVNRLEVALQRAPQTPPVVAALLLLDSAGDAVAAEVEEIRSRPRGPA